MIINNTFMVIIMKHNVKKYNCDELILILYKVNFLLEYLF